MLLLLQSQRKFGPDVCHIFPQNILYSNGGLDLLMGPIACMQNIWQDFLPSHQIIKDLNLNTKEWVTVSAAPWGRKSILQFLGCNVKMMGIRGFQKTV